MFSYPTIYQASSRVMCSKTVLQILLVHSFIEQHQHIFFSFIKRAILLLHVKYVYGV